MYYFVTNLAMLNYTANRLAYLAQQRSFHRYFSTDGLRQSEGLSLSFHVEIAYIAPCTVIAGYTIKAC